MASRVRKDGISVRINEELYECMVTLAQIEGRKIKWVLDRAVTNYLHRKKVLRNN